MKKLLSTLMALTVSVVAFASGHTVTATSTNATCHGLCNGTALATASGGIGPYGYTWTGPSYTASGATISGLCGGTYIVTATDSSDMSTAQYTVSITAPAAIGVTSGSATICQGSAVTLNATATGGTGIISYAWSPATGLSASTIANPVCALVVTTTYTITATDANGCSGTTTATVNVNPLPVMMVTPYAATCGSCNGAIGNSSTAGSTFMWTGPAGFVTTASSPTSLCPGFYTVTASLAGCTASASTTVTAAPLPTAIVTSTTPSACGVCNGGASVSASGGTAPYTYMVVPGGMATGSSTITGLCAGTYTLNVTDANGCTANTAFTINNTPTVTSMAFSTSTTSCGGSTGSITIGALTGGVPPYTYSFNGGAFTSTTNYTGLAAGGYNVTVEDANGCTYSATASVSSSSGPTSALVTLTNSGCYGISGSIEINSVTGGAFPYTYSVNGSAYSSTTIYTGLSTGTYTILVKDASGCIYAQTETITHPAPPSIVLDSLQNVSCSGGIPGNIYISILGGTPAYTFAWDNGATTEDLPVITSPGSYHVNVIDFNGCASSQSFFVTNSSSVYASVATTDANCGALGSATVFPAGGTAPYSYSWNTAPVQTTAAISSLPAGSYTCRITDSIGCSTSVYTTVFNQCYNTIKGNVYTDLNSNCIKDGAESGFAGRTVYTNGPGGYYYANTDANGDYTLLTPFMNNVVSVSYYGGIGFTPTCPVTSLNVNFTTTGDTLTGNNFGFYADPAYTNLVIHPGWSTGNPGFSKQYWICYYNSSAAPRNAVLTFVYDSVLQYVSCTGGGVHYPAQHKIEWTFPSLAPSVTWDWATRPVIDFNVPATLSTTALLHSYFEITPITGDAYPLDNTLTSDENVLGCHDPNSKMVMPAGAGPGGDILQSDSILTYTIHFQNNGNDTAHFVEVRDTLSSFLDPASVVPGASSHNYVYSLSGQGNMTFRFDNIMLPDSISDEPGSNGYFTYTAKVKAGTPVGSVINNTASIYFDYNEAVVTNTTINTLVDHLETGITETASSNAAVKVFPNPFSDNTTFVITSGQPDAVYTFELTDVLGKTVRKMNGISQKQFTIARDDLQSGIYFYKIYNAEGITGIGKVVIR